MTVSALFVVIDSLVIRDARDTLMCHTSPTLLSHKCGLLAVIRECDQHACERNVIEVYISNIVVW